MNQNFPALRGTMAIAINHVGYEILGHKSAVISLADQPSFDCCFLIRSDGQVVDYIVEVKKVSKVDGWKGMRFQKLDFTSCEEQGEFFLCAQRADGSQLMSEPFQIQPNLLADKLTLLIGQYFTSQRCVGQFEVADKTIPFVGAKNSKVDVRGGWYDASGDVSKYLSHLSYANYMNPQQTPLVVWALAYASEHEYVEPELSSKLANEAAYGADFLVRMCDPSGAFYMTVFDKWSGDVNQREICAYATQAGNKSDDWQAGYRQGGGMAIAALAKAARLENGGAFTTSEYLQTAKRAFEHLELHNTDYLDDGRENIIDDYCALLASIELFKTTDDEAFRHRAKYRAQNLLSRLQSGHGCRGWFSADDDGNRPFFHAADEGMPLVALSAYLEIAQAEEAEAIVAGIRDAVNHLLAVTHEVANEFAYPRQLVKSSDGTIKTQFFFSHENESGYWWQGENARLASLAYALRCVAPILDDNLQQRALVQTQQMLDWILGLNPYQSCMMQGVGRNVAQYGLAKFPNEDGGICNGITSSMADEDDIAFCETEDPFQSWRWGEQWLPHAAWFLLAIGK